MDSRILLVWLELLPDGGAPDRMGVVCRRHADAMVVPRGWTLDDRRESRPRLFRVSATDDAKARPKRARRSTRDVGALDREALPAAGSQLSLAMDGAAPSRRIDDPAGGPADGDVDDRVDHVDDDEVTVGEIRPIVAPGADADETHAVPWRFAYDENDDLGGVLRTDSPLLSRAFRGGRRQE